MGDASVHSHESAESVDETAEIKSRESLAQPWVSRLAVLLCVGIFLGLAVKDDYESWETLSKFGYLPADAVWDGGYWALVTSAFVHFALWHVAFNVYWLWVLGSRLEGAIGSLAFCAFLITSAFVSSSFQLAVSDNTGIGASGVVYAIFGFMCLTRDRYTHFKEVLDAQTIMLFVVWLIGCIVATFLKIWEVGNAAHVSGLLFGAAVAGTFVFKRPVMLFGLVVLVACSIIPLFWCPWSVTWLSQQAYAAHVAERFDAALAWYTKVLERDPYNAWAYRHRGLIYEVLGQEEQAQADLQKAREIDPLIEERE